MVKVTLELNKSIDQNASIYFEKVKKAKKKLKGALETLERTEKKLEKEKVQQEKKVEEKKVLRKPKWYEKLRWFVSSEGFLVIGGRDATTNEIVVKKHTDKDDLVFHTDMAGSPFFVIQTEKKKPTEITLQETSNATFVFSRAPKLGLMSADVFWATPDQVTKEAQAGEFLPKGAFMIRGKTTYISPVFDLAIGITKDGAIMAGPKEAIKKNTEKHIVLQIGGKEKTSQLAKKIQKKIGGDLDEIIRALPPCNVEMKK